MKIGIGYDIHRLVPGRKMVLGGVEIESPKGPEAHSDGDVLIHAICDAILGAMGEPDIGTRFPDSDESFKNASSIEFLREIADLTRLAKYEILSLDTIVVTEMPKITENRTKIITSISKVLRISKDNINVKGKTSEKIGEIGKGLAIAAHAAVLLKKIN
ncbi:MAG: 2-C-methyl-D-erythritol 2,4-cyclodiphosphate synthase [Candidatus Omnitrophica bacterium]|nr:2-C-methyl-D-erythritol 2,4-cyclodiphosphate synthase [Candidatus Omnitrophota bacterium]